MTSYFEAKKIAQVYSYHYRTTIWKEREKGALPRAVFCSSIFLFFKIIGFLSPK